MRLAIIFILILFVSAFVSKVVLAKGVEIALEAELGKLTAPLAVGVPNDAKAQNGPVPDEPSRGKFIWAPGVPLAGGANDGRGYVEYVINIPSKGKYTIWGRVVAWDGNSDSFWVTWRPTDPEENPQQTANTKYRWGVQQGNTWHWDRVNQWLDGGTFEREWEFDKGETKLIIWTREDATMLDCLYITDDLVSGGNMARPPTDDEVKQQLGIKPKSVDSKDKLSATWGNIKSQYGN